MKRIAKALPPHCAAVIPLDSYYNDTTDLTPEERKAINFDHPDAFDWKLLTEQIKKLKNGEAIEQPTYSYVLSNRLPETVHVEPTFACSKWFEYRCVSPSVWMNSPGS